MTDDADTPHTPEAIGRALWELQSEPNGPARNSRTEELVDLAEATGDRELLVGALLELITAYQFSAESGKALVPFARLLRMWDERPEDFDGAALHRLHWQFKWMANDLVGNPDIALESIRRWFPDMERHYRVAGHSLRPVRAAEFHLAQHIGDEAEAARLFGEWTAADRDAMSDCLACELNDQGDWHAEQGDDERALDAWAPVLEGGRSCAEEPHRILALSLLPLLRLGRYDEARRNHLRGYHLARGNGSLVPSVARHIEFCALTGNEARGLEILTEHAGCLEMADEPIARLQLLGSAALLARRLVELGHADQPVRMPGAEARTGTDAATGTGTGTVTAAQLLTRTRDAAHALARRFDERNGTDRTGRWLTARMDRAPLTDRLPLGVRGARLAVGGPNGSDTSGTRTRTRTRTASPAQPESAPAEAAAGPEDVASLVAEAHRRSEAQHPEAHDAWRAVAEAAERTGAELESRDRAEVVHHAGMAAVGDPDTAIGLFREAAERFEEAGDPGESLVSRSRAAHAAVAGGRVEEGQTELDSLAEQLRALHAEGRATARQLTTVLLAAAHVRLGTLHASSDPETAAQALRDELGAVLAFAEEHRAEGPRMASRIALAAGLLAGLLAGVGELPEALELYGRAVERCHEAGLAWLAAEPESRLARLALSLGRPQQAEQAARAALAHGEEQFEPTDFARVHSLLADALVEGGGDDENVVEDAVEHALEATHWADEAGESEEVGARARLQLGGALIRLRRFEEAASVLESTLPELQEHHREATVVQARRWLGECLGSLGDSRQAAEQFLLAADLAKGWDEQGDHAVLAHRSGDALLRAGLDEQAGAAYARAQELWQALDHPGNAARAVRARAWGIAEVSPKGAMG